MKRPTDELRKSERHLNYAKTVGALVAAAAGIFGMVIAVWSPSEPLAKAGYRAVEKTVSGLSQDVRSAYEDRKLIKERLDHLQGQMTLLLDTLHAYMEVQPPRPRRRPRRTRRPASATSAPPNPKALLEKALKKRDAQPPASPKSEPPPFRSLPDLEHVQRQAE